ncbi:MAG: hypothetical protein N2512_02640 [Armatimonadetes bacterium]|nr:hypothetical protein [Armatimonadota bacterium]
MRGYSAPMLLVAFAGMATVTLIGCGGGKYTPGLGVRYLVFETDRAETAGGKDIILFDRATRRLDNLAALNSTADDVHPSISSDGRYIAFASNRAGGPGQYDIYVYDRQTATFVPTPGLNSTGNDDWPDISADGLYVAFQSNRPGGAGGWDVYLYDTAIRALVNVSKINTADNETRPSVSEDAAWIAFETDRSAATAPDILLYERGVEFVHGLPINTTGVERDPDISASGRFLVYVVQGGPGGAFFDLEMYDRQQDRVDQLPQLNIANANDDLPSISFDAWWIAFQSDRPGGAGGADVYLYDRAAQAVVQLTGVNAATFDGAPGLD